MCQGNLIFCKDFIEKIINRWVKINWIVLFHRIHQKLMIKLALLNQIKILNKFWIIFLSVHTKSKIFQIASFLLTNNNNLWNNNQI